MTGTVRAPSTVGVAVSEVATMRAGSTVVTEPPVVSRPSPALPGKVMARLRTARRSPVSSITRTSPSRVGIVPSVAFTFPVSVTSSAFTVEK